MIKRAVLYAIGGAIGFVLYMAFALLPEVDD